MAIERTSTGFSLQKKTSMDIGLMLMTDVLLVLLFFMLVTTFRQRADLNMNVSKAVGSESSTSSLVLNLYINAQGQYLLGLDEATMQPLAQQNLDSLTAALLQ
jgi:biopolymer transport protein ExbD